MTGTSPSARFAGRAAQFLLGIPLGLFQLVAVIVFSIKGPMHGSDWLVAAWGVVMSASCAVLATQILRSARGRLTAFVLLGAQLLFGLVKLTVYHESASFVFGIITLLALVTLSVYQRDALAGDALGSDSDR